MRERGRAGSERMKSPWEVHAHVFPFSNLLLSGVPRVIESQQRRCTFGRAGNQWKEIRKKEGEKGGRGVGVRSKGEIFLRIAIK